MRRSRNSAKNDFADAHHNLGEALWNKGEIDEAIAEYRETIRFKKDWAAPHYNLGIALKALGQLDKAIKEYREAIRLKDNYPEAHCNLGNILRSQGQFTEALTHLRRGDELGSRNPNWRYPSAQWVKDCERFLELDGKLPAFLNGEQQPSTNAERLEFAELCQMPNKKYYVAAERFYREAFTREPAREADLNAQHRYTAACAAVDAGCGRGQDADKLDKMESARLRRQALDWLRADLKAYRQLMDQAAEKYGGVIGQRMLIWLKNNNLAGVRDADVLANLPNDERAEWQTLWKEVEELHKRAANKPKP
jgi:tetratricopeptide (TPR) repeat protein